ncbi:hypothetical protein PSPO01_05691 [Paraphaeosphaeria sporulosa]
MAEKLRRIVARDRSQMTTAAHQLQEFPRAKCNFAILRQGLALPERDSRANINGGLAWELTILGAVTMPSAARAISTLDPLPQWIKSRCPYVVAILHLSWSSLS